MAGLHFDITADNKNFLAKLQEVEQGVRSTSSQVQQSGQGMEQMFTNLTKAAAAFGGAFTAKELISGIVQTRGEFQKLEAAFKVMLGSEEKAISLMSQLTRTASTTPFDLQGVANSAKQLMAFGTSAEDVNGTLIKLGDIAAAVGAPLNDIVYLYGTTMTQGRMFTQDLRQFMGRGIPLAEELAKQFGVAKEQVAGLVTEGKVTADVFQKALLGLASEGGRYQGLMDAQSKTISGQIANIEDAIDMMFNEMGQKSEGAINTALSGASWAIEHYEELGKAILVAATAFGTYKAGLMAVVAMNNSVEKLTITKQIDAFKEQNEAGRKSLGLKATDSIASAQEDKSLAALKERLAEQQKIAAMIEFEKQKRSEAISAELAGYDAIIAKEQELATAKANAEAVENAAAVENVDIATEGWSNMGDVERYNELMKRQQEANDAVTQSTEALAKAKEDMLAPYQEAVDMAELDVGIAQEKMDIAYEQGNMEAYAAAAVEKAAAQEALNSAQKELNTVATNVNNAATARNTLAKTADTAATTKLTMSERLNAVGTKAATTAKLMFRNAVTQVTTSLKALWATMMSNPLTGIATLVMTVVSALAMFGNSTEELSAEQERFGESALKAISNVETLYAVMASASRGSKVHADAVEELEKIAKEYGLTIDTEKDKVSQLNALRSDLINLLKIEGQERQKANVIASYEESITKESEKLKEKIQDAMSSAEWDGSGVFDDWDAKEVQKKADQMTTILSATITDGISRGLSNDQINAEIKRLFANMGIEIERVMQTTDANGNLVERTYGIDVDFNEMITESRENITALTNARDKYVSSLKESAEATKDSADSVDYEKLSLDKLIEGIVEAKGKTDELSDTTAAPTVDDSSIKDAEQKTDDATKKLIELGNKSVSPIIDDWSIVNAQNQVSILSGQLLDLNRDIPGLWTGGNKNFSLFPTPTGNQPAATTPPTTPNKGSDAGIEEAKRALAKRRAEAQKSENTMKEYKKSLEEARSNADQSNKALIKFYDDELAWTEKFLKIYSRPKKTNKNKGSTGKKVTQNDIDIAQAEYDELVREQYAERAEEDAEFTKRRTEDEIALIQDAGERKRAERNNQFAKDEASIKERFDRQIKEEKERQKKLFEENEKIKELEAKRKNPKAEYETQIWDETTNYDPRRENVLIAKRDAEIQRLRKINAEEEKREQGKSMREYLKAYGDYEQQKKAITEEYAEKIKEAGDDSGLVKTLTAQQEEALDQLDQKFGKSAQVMADLFGDASKKSVSELQKIIDKYETLIKFLGGDSGITREALLSLGFTEDDLKKVENGTIDIKSLSDALKNLQGDLATRSPWQTFQKSLEDAFAKFSKDKDGKGGGFQGAAKGIEGIGSAVAAFTPALKEFGGNIANIFGFDDAKLQGAIDAVGGLGQTAAGVGQALSGDIVGGAMAAVQGISQMVDAFDSLFGADYSQYNRMVEQYDELSSVWDEIISKKQEYVDISYGDEAVQAAEHIDQLLQQDMEAQRELGRERLNSGASAGSHSIGVRQRKGMSQAGWDELSAAAELLGLDYDAIAGGRMEGLFDLSAQQLEDLKANAPLFWAQLDEDVKEYLNGIIECGDAIEENKAKLQESITGVSFDSFYDGFVSMLTDMDSDSKDFADNFEEYLRNAIISTFVANKYKEKLEKLYTDWATAAEDGLTEAEADGFKQEYNKIVQEGINERNALKETFGWTSSVEQQSASSKGFQAMSQDTGEELNGRFTAIQQYSAMIKDEMVNVALGVGSLVTISTINGETLNNILLQQVQANEHLETIANYSKLLKSINENIQEVRTNTNGLS